MFLGVESVWPEKNIFRKFAKIAEKENHGRAHEAVPKYRIGPPIRELFDRRL
jgi:hypothetical protein